MATIPEGMNMTGTASVRGSGRYRHYPPTIEFLLSLPPQMFKVAYPKDTAKCRKQLVELQKAGYVCQPGNCGNEAPDGTCLGHEDKEGS